MDIPSELYRSIGEFSMIRDIISLSGVDKHIDESIGDDNFWKDLTLRDYGFTLQNEHMLHRDKYRTIYSIVTDPEVYFFNLIEDSNGDNKYIEKVLADLVVTGDDPCKLIRILHSEYEHARDSVHDNVDLIYEAMEDDNFIYRGGMSDSTASYFADYVVTIGRENLHQFKENPLNFFIENIDLFAIPERSTPDWNYNIRFKTNEGFWTYALYHLEDHIPCIASLY